MLVVCSARDALKLPIKQFSIKVRDDIFQSGGFDEPALGTEFSTQLLAASFTTISRIFTPVDCMEFNLDQSEKSKLMSRNSSRVA